MILILIGLLIYTGTVIFRPHWGIYLTLLLLPSYQIRFEILGLPTTFLEWLILILAVVIFVKTIVSKNFRKSLFYRSRSLVTQNKLLTIFTGLFLAAATISVLVSPEATKAVGLWKAYFVEAVLFAWLFYFLIDTKEKLAGSFKALGFLVIGLSAFGLYQFFTLYRLPPSWWGPGLEPRRVVSLYTYPNAVSLLITPILAMFTTMLALWGKIQKILAKKFVITVLSFGLILLILTFSRGAWIGYLAAVGLIALFSSYRKLVLGLVIIAALAILIIPTTRNRLLPVFTGTDPASQERILLYKGTLEIIKEKPITGAGLYGFRGAYEEVRQSDTDEILNYPHNFFLNFWIETGILGLLSMLAILAILIKRGVFLYRQGSEFQPLILGVFAALAVILIHGQFDAPYFKNDLAVLFWIIIIIVPTIIQIKKVKAGE